MYFKSEPVSPQPVLRSLIRICVYFQSLACKPIASLDHFLPENLGSADLVEEVQTGSSKIVKVRYKTRTNCHLL